MSKLIRAILCDAYVKTSGKDNLIGIFERWAAYKLPSICTDFCLNIKVEAVKGPHILSVQVADGRDKPLGQPTRVSFISENLSEGVILNVLYQKFPLLQFGLIRFMCYVDNELVGEAFFDVVPAADPCATP